MVPLSSFAGLLSLLAGALSLTSIIVVAIVITIRRGKQHDEQQ